MGNQLVEQQLVQQIIAPILICDSGDVRGVLSGRESWKTAELIRNTNSLHLAVDGERNRVNTAPYYLCRGMVLAIEVFTRSLGGFRRAFRPKNYRSNRRKGKTFGS